MTPKIEKLDWYEMTLDGSEYVRFCATNWGEWMGESLEIVQDSDETAKLEASFQEALRAHHKEPQILLP